MNDQMGNMELFWNVIYHVSSVFEIIAMGFLFKRFTGPFLRKKRYACAVGAVYITVMLILKFIPYELKAMTAYAAGVLAAFLTMYLTDRRNAEQKVFLSVTFYMLVWISLGVVIIPWSALYDLFIMSNAAAVLPRVQTVMFIIMQILHLIMGFLVMTVFIGFIHRIYVSKKENMAIGELALMLIPSLSAIAGYSIFRYFSDTYEKDFGRYIWDIHYEFDFLLALYLIMVCATLLITIFVYQRIRDSRRREKEEAVLAMQMEDMKDHIREVEKLYGDIRSLKHDMANHVMTLEKLYGTGRHQEEIQMYMSQLKDRISETVSVMKSGNPVTDVILLEKRKKAEEKGIDFQDEFYFPKGTLVNAFDVSIILNNAADNAIEAAGACENPYVYIKSRRNKNSYMIEIRNNFTGTLDIDEDSGLPVSTKSGWEHGFGLANIRKVARKYFGDIDIELKEDKFILNVLLMLE